MEMRDLEKQYNCLRWQTQLIYRAFLIEMTEFKAVFANCNAEIPSCNAGITNFNTEIPPCNVARPSCNVEITNFYMEIPSCSVARPPCKVGIDDCKIGIDLF